MKAVAVASMIKAAPTASSSLAVISSVALSGAAVFPRP